VQKSTDSRFLKKILTDTEIEQVRCSDDPDAALWSFWACKEAAYKVIQKQTSGAAFVPRRWSVNFQHPLVVGRNGHPEADEEQFDQAPTEFTAGDVIIPDRKAIPVRLFSSLSYIHCVAADSLDALDKAIWRAVILPPEQNGIENDPSAFSRLCLARHLEVFFQEDHHHIKICRRKKDGDLLPPVAYLHDVQTDIDISLSHDGRWVAYAFIPG
jgi:hypothetical protein